MSDAQESQPVSKDSMKPSNSNIVSEKNISDWQKIWEVVMQSLAKIMVQEIIKMAIERVVLWGFEIIAESE